MVIRVIRFVNVGIWMNMAYHYSVNDRMIGKKRNIQLRLMRIRLFRELSIW